MTKRLFAGLAALLTIAAVALLPTSASAQPTASCNIRWGSQAKSVPGLDSSSMVNVRAGRHGCYDRLVVDIKGGKSFYWVKYVDQVRTDGIGKVVPLRGGARLEIVTSRAEDYPRVSYNLNRSELVNVSGYRTFRQVAGAGTFEGQSTIGLGVRARLPFRAFTVEGPGAGQTRLVIDVAHRW